MEWKEFVEQQRTTRGIWERTLQSAEDRLKRARSAVRTDDALQEVLASRRNLAEIDAILAQDIEAESLRQQLAQAQAAFAGCLELNADCNATCDLEHARADAAQAERDTALTRAAAWEGRAVRSMQARADAALTWQARVAFQERRAEKAEAALADLQRYTTACESTSAEWRSRSALAEAALAEYKANIPWESMWMYFSHGDYGPDAWHEVDEWLRTNMPQEMARTWLGMPEVQP